MLRMDYFYSNSHVIICFFILFLIKYLKLFFSLKKLHLKWKT